MLLKCAWHMQEKTTATSVPTAAVSCNCWVSRPRNTRQRRHIMPISQSLIRSQASTSSILEAGDTLKARRSSGLSMDSSKRNVPYTYIDHHTKFVTFGFYKNPCSDAKFGVWVEFSNLTCIYNISNKLYSKMY